MPLLVLRCLTATLNLKLPLRFLNDALCGCRFCVLLNFLLNGLIPHDLDLLLQLSFRLSPQMLRDDLLLLLQIQIRWSILGNDARRRLGKPMFRSWASDETILIKKDLEYSNHFCTAEIFFQKKC